MGFSRQGCWSGLPFPSPEDLPDLGIKPWSPTLQADALPSEPPAITKWSHNLRQDIFRFLGLFPHWDNEGNWNPNSGTPFSAEPLWFSPAARCSRIVIHQRSEHSKSCQSAESHSMPDCSTETNNGSNFPRPYFHHWEEPEAHPFGPSCKITSRGSEKGDKNFPTLLAIKQSLANFSNLLMPTSNLLMPISNLWWKEIRK